MGFKHPAVWKGCTKEKEWLLGLDHEGHPATGSYLSALATSKTIIKAPLEQWCEQEIEEVVLQMFLYTYHPVPSSQFVFVEHHEKFL